MGSDGRVVRSSSYLEATKVVSKPAKKTSAKPGKKIFASKPVKGAVKPSKVSTKTKVEKKGGFFAKKTPATKKASGTKTPAANSSKKIKFEKKPVEKKGGLFAKKTLAPKKSPITKKTPVSNSSKKTVSKKISNKNAVTPVAKASKPSFFDSLFKKSPPKKKLS